MPKVGDIVEVIWEDAHTHQGWNSMEQLELMHEKEIMVKTYGVLRKKDKRGITICHSMDTLELEPLGIHFIPRGMIRKVRKLR